ncbi:M6 family metalloprotease domain-containing protein [Longimicrobium sp.]|uniref:M6 family metalloprotease domain-containing protein n=1 Tax=Longimicrobium sp. TaxID=2029185 RepID=UPI002E3727CE|nr:M6 family metalloprotease domain-containing protein [Longimicrobium sp.]HEX6036618.1 M6 family metalloprotease domain-containing protein [Longimicrobium sp.]
MSARTWIAAGALAALASVPAGAQDIEMTSRVTGRPLPPGYYARVRQDPGFFELRRGWMHRGQAEGMQSATFAPGDGPQHVVLPNRGNLRMVVVMAQFSDSPQPPVGTSVVADQLFGPNPLGNLTQFYREISGGQVNLTGTVLPWVRTDIPRVQAVGTSMGLGDDADMGAYLRDAVAKLDPTTNFAQYDNDGPDGIANSGDDDGYVDVTVFQFGEIAASCGGPGVWPHRSAIRGWTGQAYRTDDLRPNGQPVLVDDYIIQSAVDCDGQPQNIATIAHETGHAFGLPDFYDATAGILPQQRRWVLGCWTLMAAGSWGCGDGSTFGKVTTPTHMGAYEKLSLGWVQRTTSQAGWRREYLLDPVQTSGRVLQVPLRGNQEYLLLEYRPQTGFDAGLPLGGVLVYHVQPDLPLRPCATCQRIYRVSLVEADGDGALIRTADEGGNRGVAGDVFAGSRTLGPTTTPALLLNSGARADVLLEMDMVGGQARIRVSTLPVLDRGVLLQPFLATTGTAPSATDGEALDAFGNRNGRYDVGDLAAYVKTRPNALSEFGAAAAGLMRTEE